MRKVVPFNIKSLYVDSKNTEDEGLSEAPKEKSTFIPSYATSLYHLASVSIIFIILLNKCFVNYFLT